MSRFSKESFNEQIKAILNDPDFKVDVVKSSKLKEEGYTVEQIAVSQQFRGFCKKLLEKFGVDKYESEKVLSEDFKFTNVDGLYEFMATCIYEYLDAGNTFNFIPRYGFKGSLELEEKPECEKVSTLTDKEGNKKTYCTFFGKHKKLKASSGCPSYLKKKKNDIV